MWCESTLDRKSDLVNDYLSLIGVFMIEEKGSSAQILERLMSSYGVNTQKDLAAALDIPANNISGWTQRDRVPGNAIIKCALDTGADLQWLIAGKLANAKSASFNSKHSGRLLYEEIMANGGKPVLRRILDAYGFTMQKQLCDLLDISSGTVSTWIRRNHFPGDVVVTCSLDTGVSLQWLATGKSDVRLSKTTNHDMTTFHQLKKLRIESGKLVSDGYFIIDPSFISSPIEETALVVRGVNTWLVDCSNKNFSNGKWMIEIDGSVDIYSVKKLPKKKLLLENSGYEFDCDMQLVVPLGIVTKTIFNHEIS